MQKVDNYSFFKRRKVKGKSLGAFLDAHYSDMQKEMLTPKLDTVYNKSGEMITGYTVLDHQLYQNISILQSDTLFHYSFHSTLMENSANLTTYQYRFLDILNKVKDKYKGRRLKQ